MMFFLSLFDEKKYKIHSKKTIKTKILVIFQTKNKNNNDDVGGK
jgi:hypothetical protein